VPGGGYRVEILAGGTDRRVRLRAPVFRYVAESAPASPDLHAEVARYAAWRETIRAHLDAPGRVAS
jgi:hypothetical protein